MSRPGKANILRAAVEVMGEDGYEGASIRDMAARAGVSVAALYYHFPSKLDMLREFLDEAYDIILARLDRRLAAASPDALSQLDEAVATLIASHLHDAYARSASNVAVREHTRLGGEDRAAIEKKRRALLERFSTIVASSPFTTPDPTEAARAIITLCTSLVEPFEEMGGHMPTVIATQQVFARAIAGAP